MTVYLRMPLSQAHEQIVQGFPTERVLMVHARDQLRHHSQPVVEVNAMNALTLVIEHLRYLMYHAVPEPDGQQVEQILLKSIQ